MSELPRTATSAAVTVLREAVDRCVGRLLEDRLPRRPRTSLYAGDAGLAWAFTQLAIATGRADVMDAAMLCSASSVGQMRRLSPAGLLHGTAGVVTSRRVVSEASGAIVMWGSQCAVPSVSQAAGHDLAQGAAGVLLAQARASADEKSVADSIHAIARGALPSYGGMSWPSGAVPAETEGRPVSGIAHGTSGVVLALVEAAVRYPEISDEALGLAKEGLRWEGNQYLRTVGGWPDVHDQPRSLPTSWCRGAAGIGAVRFRLIQLVEDGVELGLSTDLLERDAQAALTACQAALGAVHRNWRTDSAVAMAGGLGLCHGLGGPLDLLALAAETWVRSDVLESAQRTAVAMVAALDDDPMTWPGFVPGPLGSSLFLGLAGTAVVLARLAYPEKGLASPSLLCC